MWLLYMKMKEINPKNNFLLTQKIKLISYSKIE